MKNPYISFGEPIEELTENSLTLSNAQKVFRACATHKSFELVELRYLIRNEQRTAEILIVDCRNDGVPTKNTVGILYRERFGLVFHVDENKMPEVRAVRQDFPATLHQNLVVPGQPASLCLYFEPWEGVQRSWTPQSHLNRILWWLAKTAQGNLHREEQPVEPFYYQSSSDIVLPPDFKGKIHQNNLLLIVEQQKDSQTFLGKFLEISDSQNLPLGLICLTLNLAAITHGRIELPPHNLGMLEEQFTVRDGVFFKPLCAEIERHVNESGFPKISDSKTLLILQIPIRRDHEMVIERFEYKAFCLDISLGELGKSCGVLTDGQDNQYYKIPSFNLDFPIDEDWKSITIEPIEVTFALTHETAQQASGIDSKTANFTGVLAGVGALGSSLAEIWYREAWGQWIFIDPDHIKPHNLARHTAKHFQIGQSKANAVKKLVEYTYFLDYAKAEAIVDNANNWSNQRVKSVIEESDLVVDATTTLAVPRDFAITPLNRAVSVFLTPSGQGSVVLMEDAERTVRLDSLEAQYYEGILNSSWGEHHLTGHQGHFWVGAGCRDVSGVIPVELLQLHAAILARQIRLKSAKAEAAISVWHVEPESGAVAVSILPVATVLTTEIDEWKLVWNTRLQNKTRQLRTANLPNETGGVLLGYIDQKLHTIFIVDILCAPLDSIAEPDGFIRGTQGLIEKIQTAQARTANIVSYIGEWHSHPRGISVEPSEADKILLSYLADALNNDGIPGVMMIIGDDQEAWSIQE
jgi:integrative and conjugative element protein (TIGR02256 family)